MTTYLRTHIYPSYKGIDIESVDLMYNYEDESNEFVQYTKIALPPNKHQEIFVCFLYTENLITDLCIFTSQAHCGTYFNQLIQKELANMNDEKTLQIFKKNHILYTDSLGILSSFTSKDFIRNNDSVSIVMATLST